MSVKFTNTSLPDIIELKNISQTYDEGKSFVIKNLNILIEDVPNRGQFVVLLGASGCGKSTLLRYIAGIQTPSSGDVLIKGTPRKDSDRIGMVFQQYSSFPWMTVLENVALGLKFRGLGEKERNERAMEMIRVVGLEGHEKKYATYPALSGGQLQRVAIARSLLVNPEIVLMDEPFGALDTYTRMKMQDFLHQLWKEINPTIVLVTHDISEAVYLADDIYIMSANPGELVEHIQIELPPERQRALKRDRQFVEYVQHIEDTMIKLQVTHE
ncbi:MAG: ABC transporter ATP-binding protein [Bacteroidales bacterium]